ncbi:MAG: hypothetical protein AB7O37_11600 [Vicinamibacteria bacterium]
MRAVVFFGSRKTRPSPDPWSAWDFFVVVSGYRPYFDALASSGAVHRSPALLALVSRWLPPSQVSLRPLVGGETVRAKCSVISLADFERATSGRRRDHFCAGRLFQPTEVAWTASDADRRAVLAALASAHQATLGWARPWLDASFDALELARRLLEVSLRAEIRPEPSGRAEALIQGQAEYHRAVYGALLEEQAAAGTLRRAGEGRYAAAAPAGTAERLGLRIYFLRSLIRATLRWGKHMLTFEDWLDYIVHKIERHGGQPVELTPRERRWPLVFLWPRLWRFLRAKDHGR